MLGHLLDPLTSNQLSQGENDRIRLGFEAQGVRGSFERLGRSEIVHAHRLTLNRMRQDVNYTYADMRCRAWPLLT